MYPLRAIAFCAAVCTAFGASVDIPFAGLDRLHTRFSYSTTDPRVVSVRAVAIRGDTQRVLQAGTTSLQGQAQVTGLEPGDWAVVILEKTRYDTTPPKETEFSVASASATIGPKRVYGSPLYSESFAGLAPEAEIHLWVSNQVAVTFSGLTNATLAVDFYGGSVSVQASHLRVLSLSGPGQARLDGSVVEEFRPGAGGLELHGCVVRGTSQVRIPGTSNSEKAQTLALIDSEVHPPLYVISPRPLTLQGTVFVEEVALSGTGWGAAEAPVTIERNTFYGARGLSYQGFGLAQPVPIGLNYFCDPLGPNQQQFGVRRGATVDTEAFPMASDAVSLRQALTYRRTPRDPEQKVYLRNNGVRVGQNVLNENSTVTIRGDRPTLVTVDLIPNVPKVEHLRVFARVGTTDYEVESGWTAYRELEDLPASKAGTKALDAERGALTANIILPPNLPTQKTLFGSDYVTVEVWLDGTAVPNFYSSPKSYKLADRTLYTMAKPARQMRVLVVPVQVTVTNALIVTNAFATAHADIQPTVRTLRNLVPAMLPLTAQDIRVATAQEFVFDGAKSGLLDNVSATYFMLTLADALEGHLDELNSGLRRPADRFDRVVGVLPAGLMGAGTDGFNARGSATVCLVDEARPVAVIHELGHSFGINRELEEYNYIGTEAYNSGYPVRETAFVPEEGLDLDALPSHRGFGRIHHCGAKGMQQFVNVMGCAEPVWINGSTWSSFQGQIQSLLKNPDPTVAQQDEIPAPLPEGWRRMLVSGWYAAVGKPWPFDKNILDYSLLRGTIRAEDVTGDLTVPIVSRNSGKSDRFNAYVLDAKGYIVWSNSTIVLLDDPRPAGANPSYWSQTFDLPPDAAGFELNNGEVTGPPLLTVDGKAPLQARLAEPAGGAAFAPALAVRIEANKTNVSHRLAWRKAGGGAWTPLLGAQRSSSFQLSADFLDAPGTIDLRVISSDGWSRVENVVTGLRLDNRPPRVRIASPAPGAIVSGAIRLAAWASDPDGGAVAPGAWSSSLQGALGSGPILDSVVLQAGRHVLTYTTTDAQGASGQAQIEVTAAPPVGQSGGGSGLSAALIVQPAEWPRPTERLVLGMTNRLELMVTAAAGGRDTRLRWFVKPPAGAEIALGSGSVAEGVPARLRANFAPTAEGDHAVRVVFDVEGQTSERRWTLPAYEPDIRVTIEPAAAVAAGAQWRLDNGAWRASGERLAPADIDPYGQPRIVFKPLPGWATAPNFVVVNERAAALTVIGVYRLDGFLPYFTRQPQSVTTVLGAPYITISAGVSGSPNPIYQWFKDGVAVPKATRTALTFDKVEAANVGSYVLQASNVFGVVLSDAAQLIVPGIGPSSPFDTWIAAQQLPAGQSGPNDDPDQDGISNLVEFAMALDPKAPDARPIATAEPVIDQNEVYLGYVYRRPKDAAGNLRYVITASRSLERWENLPTQTARVTDRGAYEEVVVRTTAPMSQAASGFVMMRVERP